MKSAIRKAGALGVFAACIAALLPSAHGMEVRLGSGDKSIVVSWDRLEPRRDYSGWPSSITGYWITLSTRRLGEGLRRLTGYTYCPLSRELGISEYLYNETCFPSQHATQCLHRQFPTPRNCIRRDVGPGRASYSETFSGLSPGTTYYVTVDATVTYKGTTETIIYPRYTLTWGKPRATITTGSTPPQPENPTTPDPETPDCTYKHRLIGVPGTTAAGYTSQILISSEASNATATIRAYQADNGHQIDVLDSEGSAIGSTTSLAPAHSVKRFSLEEIPGWHSVIVEHPSKAAMENATVAMRIREPDVGVEIDHVQGIEHCTNTATTAE